VAETASVVIRAVRLDEGPRLKEIAIAAKGVWGYESEKVQEWADQGDFSPQRLRELTVFVAEAQGRQIGWCSLIPRGAVWSLEDLWVEPDRMCAGVGASLFRRAARHAKEHGARRMEWEAEPNAIGFYEKLGATYLRDSELTSWGRRLTVMGVELDG
jgi:GNAT superfamily N-acetyltransferase